MNRPQIADLIRARLENIKSHLVADSVSYAEGKLSLVEHQRRVWKNEGRLEDLTVVLGMLDSSIEASAGKPY